MELSKSMLALGGSLVMGLASSANADSDLEALKARVAELEAKQNTQMVNQARAAEFNALVNDVLADQNARTSQLAAGAGHDGKFFLASEDGSSRLNISGQVQFRYIFNSRDESSPASLTGEEAEAGFQNRRSKLKFSGKTNGVGYKATLSASRTSQNISLEDVLLTFKLTDNIKVSAGRDKAKFNLEEKTSSSKQVAVERTVTNEIFNVGRIEGLFVEYSKDNFKAYGAIGDGARTGEIGGGGDFNANTADLALTGRVEYKVAGTWAQGKDQSAWSGEGQSLIVGAGLHYQDTKGAGGAAENFIVYTADAAFEQNGWSVTGAFYGATTSNVTGGDRDHYGATGQVAYFFDPDKKQAFVRVESYDVDMGGATSSNVIWAAGVNIYQKGHAAKFTADVVFANQQIGAFTGGPLGMSSGVSASQGLLNDATNEDGQTAVRLQYQLLF